MNSVFQNFLICILMLCLGVACTEEPLELEDNPGDQNDNPGGGCEGTVKASAVWKRVSVLQADLSRALELSATDLCQELDSLDCFSEVHLAALGGNEPFKQAQYSVIPEPSAITAVAVDRVVLASCANRVDADRALNNEARVFVHYDLSAMADANDNNYLSSFDQQNTDLYRRLLARDPSSQELTIMRKLLNSTNPISNQDIAKLSCYAIASSSEFIFI